MIACAGCGRNMPDQCLYCAVCGSRLPLPIANGGVLADRVVIERQLTQRGKHLMTLLGKDRQSGQQLVLKELRYDLRTTPQQKQAFQDEVRVLTQLNIPGIPPARGVFQHEGRSYLALAFVPGQTLRSVLLKQPRISVDQAMTLLRTVCSILQALHDQFPPMLHGDVTPDNLLMGGWDKLVLLDGAWMRRLGNPLSGAPAFDEAYAAPEAFHGQPEASSDLYALGVTIVEALTGTPAARLFNPHQNRPSWDPVPHPLLQEILLRMTDGSTANRLTAQQVLQALAQGVLPPAAAPFNAFAQPADPFAQAPQAFPQGSPYGQPQQPYGQPPQQQGYPPNAYGQYPPQQQGYPPQQQGFPPQQPGYPPQQQGFPPGYPAQPQQGYPPQYPGQQPAAQAAPPQAPPAPPPPPAAAPSPPPAYTAPKLTAAAAKDLGVASPPPPPPPPPPPAPPPPPKAPPKIVDNIDDVSTEEGLEALMALYEAQNT